MACPYHSNFMFPSFTRYIYDEETELYYLRSRFYNHDWERFCNADKLLAFYNLFSYCENSPSNKYDSSGAKSLEATHTTNESPKPAPLPPPPPRTTPAPKYPAIYYDVPLYCQYEFGICWAVSQIMVEDYFAEIQRTHEEALQAAITLAKDSLGDAWNDGGYPTNGTFPRLVHESQGFLSMKQLYDLLDQYGPLYIYYEDVVNFGGGHIVVLKGIDIYRNMLYTNNPWGITGHQTYSEFCNGFIGMEEDENTKWVIYDYVSR